MTEHEPVTGSRNTSTGSRGGFDAAEIGALAHLYLGEVYRSTIWRTRLDATTNWSVVTLGIALSITFARPAASPLPLLLVALLIAMFLVLESRRYRYFNVWRARCRWIENNFYAPLLQNSQRPEPGEWQAVLAQDYLTPQYHISYARAMGRRIRRNYGFIFAFQAIAYLGKLIIHPTPIASAEELFARTAIGPIPGTVMFAFGILFHSIWIVLAVRTRALDRESHRGQVGVGGMG